MEELYKLIPDSFAAAIRARLCLEKLCELRVRNGMPLRVLYDGAYYYLGDGGITKSERGAFVASGDEAERIVMRACDHSLYTVTDTIKRGYIAVSGGIRIGVCGSGVTTNGALGAVKDFTSVNIRLPHQVVGCASGMVGRVVSADGIRNTLIVSSPGGGKTTVLRDLCRLISERGYNVLLCDEKYEIASAAHGAPTLDVGRCTDVMSGIDKKRVFAAGIANMRPDVIMTDELFDDDIDSVKRAAACGIAVIATVHARDVAELSAKPDWKEILENKIFARFAVITAAPRRDVSIFDAECAI